MAPAADEDKNLALFIDFDNIALGLKGSAKKFRIRLVLERLLEKGKIIIKKAYADWSHYPEYKSELHAAGIEMIEIPKRQQSGKNSADIRLAVDAMDLCWSKEHLDTFVILSGDSDFSPLVSKLRENNKLVIGVGVKKSTSDLLMASCDEFIFYDDLVREEETKTRKPRRSRGKGSAAEPAAKDKPAKTPEDRKQDALDLILGTLDALTTERGEEEKIWGSMIKQALKRRKPGFNESYYGYRSFSDVLEDAEKHRLLHLERDEKSGGYIVRLPKPDGD